VTELHELFAWQQRDALADGSVSPVELTEHYLARIERRNPALTALVEVTAEAALERARALQQVDPAERPLLWGLPLADKDLAARAGVPTRFGSRAFADNVPGASDPIVTAMDRAGAISLGKTATPEFGLVSYTDSTQSGPTRNPWDLSTDPGGSSGGAAAAVSAGLLPAAVGSDGGGSIRIPAGATGLVGLKPTRGLVPALSGVDTLGGLPTAGPLGRTVRDVALLLTALVEDPDGFPFTLRAPGRRGPYDLADPSDAVAETRYRIGVNEVSPWSTAYPITLGPEARAAFELAQRELSALQHDLIPVDLPLDPDYPAAFTTLWRAGAAAIPIPPDRESLLEPITRWLRDGSAGDTAASVVTALGTLSRFERSTLAAYAGVDAVLTPLLAMLPRPVGWYDRDDAAHNFQQQCQYTPYTAYVNVAGLPAIALPVAQTEAGIPMGVQLIGRPGGEMTLLRIAAQLEQRLHWQERHPAGW
jgi:amidase